MTYFAPRDFRLEVARNKVSGMSSCNQFGRAPDGVQTTITDIWDRADATPTQQVWVAPTQARIHAIVSSSASDASGGVGARTIKVYGLTSWAAAEVTETVTLNGVTPVNTVNSYVIIHRMEVLTKGATNVNVGTITATAATDATITAAILPSIGSTRMAIYGVPSGKTAYIGRIYANILKSGGVAAATDIHLKVNPEPNSELLNFAIKHTFAIAKDGTSAFTIPYYVPKVFPGPCIIKMSGIASAADQDISAGFDLILIND